VLKQVRVHTRGWTTIPFSCPIEKASKSFGWHSNICVAAELVWQVEFHWWTLVCTASGCCWYNRALEFPSCHDHSQDPDLIHNRFFLQIMCLWLYVSGCSATYWLFVTYSSILLNSEELHLLTSTHWTSQDIGRWHQH
jgi:hypothetical protein